MLRGTMNQVEAFLTNLTQVQQIILIIFVLVVGVSLFYASPNAVVCLLVFSVAYLILRPSDLASRSAPTETTIRENNQIKKKTIYLNPELEGYLQSLRKYKRYNRIAYTEGKKHIKMFQSHLLDLLRDDMAHPRQSFENAQLYLTLALNHFHSISFSIPENNYNSTLRYNKTISHKLVEGLSKTCKDMYAHCYALLVSISETLNVDFRENPDMYKSGIVLTPENVRASNEVSSQEMF
jgi:hypothetical protein